MLEPLFRKPYGEEMEKKKIYVKAEAYFTS